MKLSDRALAWTILAVVGVLVSGGLTFWWLRANVIAPSCGDSATAQLDRAVDELSSRIPSLHFTRFGDSCDSGGQVYASWEHDGLDQLLTQAVAAGCRVEARDPDDLDSSQSITCGTTGRDVILTAELGSVPLEGLLLLS
ncbi:hypothetical protein ATK74_2759 [Propionicimonas paludicola]|uniref:Uncharacterized protein n=1 Tax=Propionicimonas paludicola TaxID=185243 RepID=A0A2A9CUR0_9ACTN|nr:hypothetical protein [Propionicimonas paludicola]PFG18177.1 hypothetical protein ATK74_2759 [Propionicimonas paludicola]